MKIKFSTFENVKKFINHTSNLEHGVLVKKGRYIIDGKSLLGILSLDLTSELEIELVETNDNDVEKFISKMKELEICIEE